MSAPTILTRRLTKQYGETKVVNALDLRTSAGEVFGLLGPNGAGKTTTILMLLGMVEPTSGDIEVLGLDPARNPLAVKSRVGYLPDAVGFYPDLTGRENLRFTAELNRLSRTESDNRIDSLLVEVGLVDAGDRPVGEYSRGMKQRLGIADALIKRPEILILDEPTTAIDPEGVAEILGLIRRLAKDEGVTILLSSHLLHQVQAVCDRVAIFVKGKVVAQGAPHELATDSKGPEEVEISVGADEAAVRAALANQKFLRSL
jgi:ABC-2 type transport system ATP-binding protein